MPNAKIEIKIGGLHFLCEADEEWASTQLDKIIAKADVLGKLSEKHDAEQDGKKGGGQRPIPAGTLASFLSTKNATTNQVRKFLATAGWLFVRGKAKMQTSDVTKALKDSHQSKLGNPADCLNQNVAKGMCEKEGGEFFITHEGLVELGIEGA